MTLTIRKSVMLSASKDTVWDHLTRAELLGKWFNPARADLSEGQPYELYNAANDDTLCWGTVEKLSPKDHMRWSFTVSPLNGTMTTVTWDLETVPGGTQLSLVHSGLPEGAEDFAVVLGFDKGWHEFMGRLHEIDKMDLPTPCHELT